MTHRSGSDQQGDLTDDEWALLKPLLLASNNRCGRWRDHRQVISGIIHRLGTGAQWRELPERFGPWQTVCKRHALWSADGTWEMLLQHVQAQVDAEGGIDWDVSVDSAVIRAHQHAAGAPKAAPPPPRPSERAAESTSGPAAPAGGGREAGECPGRSRGGFTTKVHLSAECRCRPLPVLITPGQQADCTQFEWGVLSVGPCMIGASAFAEVGECHADHKPAGSGTRVLAADVRRLVLP
ncbi:IS5 family transposase [Streptomyces sp. NPDC093089]|uniref:IS5 family transposase n=1 Tax=Streptomyces sp. NPDC093089 TaxID=3366024 RepID=UPI00382EF849